MLDHANDDLVRSFTADGPPLLVDIDMLLTEGGDDYRWTSATPPPVAVSAGTIATTSVVVREQAPVTLLVPAFKTLLGLA